MTAIFPYLLSTALGYLLIRTLFRNQTPVSIYFYFFVSIGAGLGLSTYITFFSFLLFDQLNQFFVLAAHAVILCLFILTGKFLLKLSWKDLFIVRKFCTRELLLFLILIFASVPLLIHCQFYPNGGWDAWSCWNLKARYLFLGGEEWQNMLNPILWRSSPHYPLLLPLINVWGWMFSDQTLPATPMITSVVFTFITSGLLLFSLNEITSKIASALGMLLIAVLPFFVTIGTSQYCDIVLGYFLLGSFVCAILGIRKNSLPLIALSGLFLGFLSFTKPEGTLASLLIVFLFCAYLVLRQTQFTPNFRKIITYFLITFLFSALPTILFQIVYSPGNQTFINGLSSSSDPSNFSRLQLIGSFFLVELGSQKWNGLWIFLGVGIVLMGRKCWQGTTLILPLFFLIYLLTIFFYYFLNTYFAAAWWLSVTLNRILLTLLPSAIFWVFSSLGRLSQEK
ncbi:MAG: glycosyltransferase family 39 protein [Candidatus Omnitrophota bacterium]